MGSLILTILFLSAFSAVLSALPRSMITISVEKQTTAFTSVLFLLSIMTSLTFDGQSMITTISIPWFTLGCYALNIGIVIDAVSLTLMTLVTFITMIVQIYSWGYLENDAQRPRFFALISFFCFQMLLLIFSSNLLMLFMAWEGVGLASFLLIGFWREKATAIQASVQAFLTNRVGDWGLLVALLVLLHQYQHLDFFLMMVAPEHISEEVMILLLLAAITKSAQLPLGFWLPGSMEGPTPISALIHAATMVTAGIYLFIRFMPALSLYPQAQQIVVILALITIVSMSLRACLHNNLKKIIAYSTMAQLGYMFVAIGLLQPEIALFHLWNHGFFKALLFLCAGAIIIIADHEQNIKKLSGILREHKSLQFFFSIALFSLIACPASAGFFSKELILISSESGPEFLPLLLKASSFLTAIYSGRLFGYLVLRPLSRSKKEMHALPNTISFALSLLTAGTIFINIIIAYPELFMPFPWQPVVSHHDWVAMIWDPMSYATLIVFVLTALIVFISGTQSKEIEPRLETDPLFDVLIRLCVQRLYVIVQLMRSVLEKYFEQIIALCLSSVVDKIAAPVLGYQKLSLRSQMIILIGFMALMSVMLQGDQFL